jgi:hypothetical protein
MTLYDIVTKLIGPISPVGQTEVDSKRLDNLRETTQLIDDLLSDIASVANDKGLEWSVKQASDYAVKYLRDLIEYAEEYK